MLLVLGNQFSYLYKHFFLFVLIHELVVTDKICEIVSHQAAFQLQILRNDVWVIGWRRVYILVVSQNSYKGLDVAIWQNWKWLCHHYLEQFPHCDFTLKIFCFTLKINEMVGCLLKSQMMCFESLHQESLDFVGLIFVWYYDWFFTKLSYGSLL